MNRIGDSETSETVPTGTMKGYQIALTSNGLVNDSGSILVIYGYKTIILIRSRFFNPVLLTVSLARP